MRISARANESGKQTKEIRGLETTKKHRTDIPEMVIRETEQKIGNLKGKKLKSTEEVLKQRKLTEIKMKN